VTPWDLGQPTPVILHLHQTGALPKGRALIPGCGSVSSMVLSNKMLMYQFNFIYFNASVYIYIGGGGGVIR
jgi:hypothetical protein